MTAARTPEKGTISDLLDLGDEARMDLIDGALVPRDANPSPDHGYAQASLTSTLFPRFSRGGGGGGDAPGGWWIATEVHVTYGAQTACCHDVVGWRRERATTRPTDVPVALRPDWVCEILSTNRSNDLVLKMNILRNASVPHYWLVDPVAGVLTVHRLTNGVWTVALSAGRNERVRAEPFDAVELETNALFGVD